MNLKNTSCVLILLLVLLTMSVVSAEDVNSDVNSTIQAQNNGDGVSLVVDGLSDNNVVLGDPDGSDSGITPGGSTDEDYGAGSAGEDSGTGTGAGGESNPDGGSSSGGESNPDGDSSAGGAGESSSGGQSGEQSGDQSADQSNDDPVETPTVTMNYTTLQEQIDSYVGNPVVITLKMDVAHGDDEVGVKENIVISRFTTINGNGYTIDAMNRAGIFVVNPGVTLQLINVGLTNADSGAISAGDKSTLLLDTVTFSDNQGSLAGAIYTSGVTSISNSIFNGNKAINKDGAAAIYQKGGENISLTIINSEFTGNNNTVNPVATIVTSAATSLLTATFSNNDKVIYSNGSSKLLIDDSTFESNNASSGSVIDINNNYDIKDSEFINNTAVSSIVVAKGASTGTLTDCLFENNTATNGGAYEAIKTQATLENCRFINNTATAGNGGAVSVNPESMNDAILNIKNSNFINNTAPAGKGGALYNKGNVTINKTMFVNNTSLKDQIFNEGVLYYVVENFTDLQVAVSVDCNIIIGQDIVMTAEEAGLLSNGVTVLTNTTINGNGYTIDANNLGRIFNVTDGITLNIYNATLANGNTTKHGGAIYNDGTVTLRDVTLVNNTATWAGGAIYNSGNLEIIDSNFSNNIAAEGGAIYNNHVNNVNINGIVFDNNTAKDGRGGAIFNTGSSDITIFDCNFTNNDAKLYGGAISNYNGCTNIIVDASTFVNNTAQNGGAISNEQCTKPTITDSTFVDNEAEYYGGAIYNTESDMSITGSDLIDNTAGMVGGAIYNDYDGVSITDSTFVNNTATDDFGGAIYNEGDGVSITDSRFEDNEAVAGGAIYNTGEDVIVSAEFISNTAQNGGAIVNEGEGVSITDSTFDSNTADKYAGAIYNFADNLVVSAEFISNTAQNGGAIVNKGNKVSITGSTFEDNEAESVGAAIYNVGADSSVTDSTFDANTGKEIGAIYNGGSNFKVEDSIFTNNKATSIDYPDGGAAIFNNGTDSSVTGSTFEGNEVVAGAAIYNNATGFTVSDSIFTKNTAVYSGAAIYNSQYATGLTVNNSNFTENAITGTNNNDGGAAIANMANDVVVANSTFTKNTAEDNGGAIYNEGNNLAVSNSIFDNNTAGKSAGAIFNNGGSNFKVDNSNFTNNEAKTNVGGAIYNEDESAIISNSVFDSNVAKVSGAAIANVNAAGVKVTGSNFTNNKAASGAAIYNENGDNLAVSDSIFNDNEVTTMGGAIYGIGNGLTITSSKFNNNKATQQGGAIINMGDSLTVKDSTFDNNTANTGGAIADVGTTFNVNNATFTNNKATGTPGTYDGGAIYYQNLMGTTGLTVKDSTFDSNTANIGGGAIVNWAFNLDIEGSTFNNNKVENESGMGGAIVNIFGGTVKDSTFDNNTANAGGAIFNMLSYETYSLSVNNVTFNANEATLGAAIYNYNTATNVDITGSKFTNNNAVAGAIYNNATGFTVSDSEFANNNATLGVDVCNAEKGVLDLTNNKYTVITGDKTNVYNIGTLAKANITVLDNKTVKAGYKDNITVYATITIDTASVAGKNLTFTINGTDQLKAESLLNGKYVANFTTEVKGIYPVTSAYDGVNTPDYYSGVLNVSKADPVLNMTVSDIFVGDLQIIAVKINNGATGLITLYINNNTFNQTLPIYEGEVKFYLQNLSAGNYSILLNYTGDENFNNGTNNTNFTVFKRLANLTVDVANITFGDDAIILISLPSDITNTTMIVYVNDVPQTVNITNGFGKLILSNLDAGNYTIKTKFESNYKYLNDTFETTLNVAKADPNLNVIINNVVYGENSIITATVTGVNGNPLSGSVIVTINGKTYEVIVDNDKGILEDAKLGANYYYTFDAYWKGDDNYNDANDTGSFSVEQAIPTLDVIVTDIIVGDDAFIEIFLPEDINGTVLVSLDDASYNRVTLINGYGNITYKALANDTYEGLPGGEHSVKVWYPGNANYTDIDETYKFNVTKFDVDMDVDMGDIVFGDNETIVVILPDDATGDVNITVDGKSYIRSLENGKANVTISGLHAGTYDVNITYSGNGRYNDFEGFTAFDVAKANSELNVEISDVNIGEEITITATLVGENGALVNGTVSVLINGKPYTIKVVDSEGNVSADAIDTTGNVSFIAIWDGDNNYNYDYDVGSFEVTKVTDCNVTIDIPGDIKAGENSTISVKVPEDATGNVTISIDGKNYTAAVKDGVANVTIPPLDAGKHNITTTYSGDNKYDAVTKNGTITVESAIYTNVNLTADNVVMIYNDGSRFKAVLLDADGNPIANATLVFAINGVSYDRITDANGTASIGINLAYGLYNVTVSYAGDDKYNATSVNATVNIISSIAANDLVKMWRNGTQFYANFTDSHGNPLVNTTVRFNINGVFYKRDTNANGTAMLNINLNPGKYILTAYNNVTGEQRGFNVLVKSLVETTDLTKYYMNESRFEAKVYNYDGSLAANKTVTFNINGVFYKGTSDANGTVSLAIKLRPANYTITSMYEGLSIGNSVEVLPTLQTSDLSMTYNDGSAFKVKTLDGQGKALANQNITFNVNGMFYYKTTGNDGVASLNINLAAGEYIITSIWDDYQVGNKITIKR